MAKLTIVPVLFVTTLLALAGCSKNEAEEPDYGASTPAEPENTTGGDVTSAQNKPVEQPKASEPAASEAASAKAAVPSVGEPKIMALSDGQIAKVMATVDSGEIDQAKLAQQKSKNAQVKKFAAMMIKQHGESKRKGEQLVKREGITPETSPLADELESGSSDMMNSLADADAAQFDKVYIDGQVDQHAKVLGLLEERLIPSAAHDALRSELVDARTMVNRHLNEAKQLQLKLPSGAAAP